MDRYEASRHHLRDAVQLAAHRCPSYGTRSFLIDLIDRGLARGLRFQRVADLQAA